MLVILLAFLFFLFRNPEYWIRRLSYACAMAAIAVLTRIGSVIELVAASILSLDSESLLAQALSTFTQHDKWAGTILLIAAFVFALIDLVRVKCVKRFGKCSRGRARATDLRQHVVSHGETRVNTW